MIECDPFQTFRALINPLTQQFSELIGKSTSIRGWQHRTSESGYGCQAARKS
jgi:hypothetical protein